MKTTGLAVRIGVTLLVVGSLAVAGETTSDSIEYKLAVINGGPQIQPSDPAVVRFREILRRLDEAFVEDKQQLADMSVWAQRDMKKRQIDVELLVLMEDLSHVYPRPIPNQKYSEAVGMYMAGRDKGMTHEQAMKGFKDLLRSLGIY